MRAFWRHFKIDIRSKRQTPVRFTLYYTTRVGRHRARHAKLVATRSAALAFALDLYRLGHSPYALASDSGEVLDAAQIFESARGAAAQRGAYLH